MSGTPRGRDTGNVCWLCVDTLSSGLCLGCGGINQQPFSQCESCGAPVEPSDGSSHYAFGEWHDGNRQHCPECNDEEQIPGARARGDQETLGGTPTELAPNTTVAATGSALATTAGTPTSQSQRHLTQTEQSLHLAQANTPSSASFLESALSTKRAAASLTEAAQDVVVKVHANEPTVERAEDIGMLTKGDNTTASEFSDIEHQPGPEQSALGEAPGRPPSSATTRGHRDGRDCEMCCYGMQRAQGSVSFHRVFIDKLF